MKHIEDTNINETSTIEEFDRLKALEIGIDIEKVYEALEYIKSNFPEYKSFHLFKDGYLVFEDINNKPYECVISKVIRRALLLNSKINNFTSDSIVENYDDLCNMRSATKSIISLLIGIALDNGFIKGIDEKVASYFPEFNTFNNEKAVITIKHLLTMKSGYGQIEGNILSSLKFVKSNNWVKYIFDLPLHFKPDEKFEYNSANTHILSAILTKATGMSASDFAEKYLFNPLGIKKYKWEEDPTGYNFGAGNLFLKPRDMAKIGHLILNNGVWDNKQIISHGWIKDSFNRQHYWDFGFHYGYLWYIKDEVQQCSNIRCVTYSAAGAGGQKILMVPELNILLVLTSKYSFLKDRSYHLNLMISKYMISWIKN